MKKIKISEAQVKLIQKVSEEGPKITKEFSKEELTSEYNKIAEYKTLGLKKADRFYNLITNLTISEIVNNVEIQNKLRQIHDDLTKTDQNCYALYKKLNEKTEMLPDEPFDEWGDRIQMDAWDSYNALSNKIDAVTDLIDLISGISEQYSEKELDKHFKDIQPDIEV